MLKGHLDGLLLASLEGGARHGYAVKESLKDGSDGRIDLPTGTIYPALRRLEQSGLIRGTWDTTGSRPRRVYELTGEGKRALSGERAGWQEFVKTMTALLEGQPCPDAT